MPAPQSATLSRAVVVGSPLNHWVSAPDETTTLVFHLEANDLAFLGPDLEPRLEPGAIDLFIGRSADPNNLLTTRIQLELC